MNAPASLSDLRLEGHYRTGGKDPAELFYKPCLSVAHTYDRAVGYFRSTVFTIVGPELVRFAKSGGKVRLVCSPSLSSDDVDAIARGYVERDSAIAASLSDELDHLLDGEQTSSRTKTLATLVRCGALDIRIAFRGGAHGQYHEKIGIFSDANNVVTFLGSANETWNGWHFLGNHEAIEVFCSWHGPEDRQRIGRHREHFHELWEGRTPGVQTLPFPEVPLQRLKEAGKPDLADLEDDPPPAGEAPTRRQALPHQDEAIQAWLAAGERGIFQHATGSGKTFTALLAVNRHVGLGNPAVILVPSALLLDQWQSECGAEIQGAAVVLAGAGHDSWRTKGRLRAMTSADRSLGPRLVLATMQTAATDAFRLQVAAGPHLLLVADEVHQIGSPFNSNCLQINAGSRLGLSATPSRYGDPDGTSKIFDYFGGVVGRIITLEDAIAAGRLVPYEYHPHAVTLTASEADSWKGITRDIVQEIARSTREHEGKSTISERAKLLLIQRARIAKKAANKVRLAVDVLRTRFCEGQRWLVYCEDQEQLAAVRQSLLTIHLRPAEYHTAMASDGSEALEWFKNFGGILLAIRCLDEGIDIPAVDHALILASSQNPRQFIQRRGRVLRRAEGKDIAYVHDAIVVPIDLASEPEQFSLLKSEFLRAIEFAKSALNRDGAAELRRIAVTLGFDPDASGVSGMEEE